VLCGSLALRPSEIERSPLLGSVLDGNQNGRRVTS
jgi:hypothetical protein